MLTFLSAICLAWAVYASNTDLLSVLSAQPSLSKFTSLVNDYPNLLAVANAGDVTIVAPNDEAFDTFFATPSSGGNYSSPDELYALMQYHVLKGAHASVSITSTPAFFPTLLTNSSYTNVTSGQVVEAVTNQTTITFRSAVHQISKIVGSEYDIIFIGGFIHIVDAVMVPPLNTLATVTEYPLTYFIDLISVVLNSNFVQTVENIAYLPNQTYFAPNSPSMAQDIANLTQALPPKYILEFEEYDIIPGQVVYSTDLTNGSKWPTDAGVDLTITELNGNVYVNDAKITISNILIANGVLHVVDKYLNVSRSDARPQLNNATVSPTSDAINGRGGLSTGTKAGIGVGVAVAVLALITLITLFIRRRPKNDLENEHRYVLETEARNIHEKDSHDIPHELITKSYDAAELHARTKPQELNGDIKENHVGISTTEESRR